MPPKYYAYNCIQKWVLKYYCIMYHRGWIYTSVYKLTNMVYIKTNHIFNKVNHIQNQNGDGKKRHQYITDM